MRRFQFPWLESTATFRPPLNTGSMPLGSTSFGGQRHRVGTGENGERNGGENGRDRPTGQGTDKERRKGRRTEAMRPTGSGREKATVGGECDGVPGVLRGRKCRLYSALTTSGTGRTEDWSRHSGEFPRLTWTWESSRRKMHRRNIHP